MKKSIYLLLGAIVMALALPSFGQNLLGNPSFEVLDQCPDDLGQADRVTSWEHSTHASVFNVCASPESGANANANHYGGCNPASGAGYMGFASYGEQHGYLITQLEIPLNAGEAYTMSINTRLGSQSMWSVWPAYQVAASALDAADPNLMNSLVMLPGMWGTDNGAGYWSNVTMTFIPSVEYRTIVIGQFRPDGELYKTGAGGTLNASYTYVDDMCLHSASGNCTAVGVEDALNAKAKLYPNPSVDGLSRIEGATSWEIMDLQGRILKTGAGDIVDGTDLASGTYIVHAGTERWKWVR
jgi:hypothetical protein